MKSMKKTRLLQYVMKMDLKAQQKKKKGTVFAKEIGIIVAVMKLLRINEHGIDLIVDILRNDLRHKDGYSRKL